MSVYLNIKEHQDKIIELEYELEITKRIDTYSGQTVIKLENEIKNHEKHINFFELLLNIINI
ncbi:hypothetical protein LPBF_12180 [Flavobacterium crassostreae]|uniref:Uncharacterized protein n=1 Tax=Flavobacterium crassostreae TaxID=1763534 RepID=A0A1B9DKG0_9FLAO|nr:hypothetical protein [Flavobacterium crassostreae]OCB70196.1 hypothetical protein LPBF_12180 [Flavobacterium crassostreae]